MTVGPLPRHPGLINNLIGGPLIVPLTPLDNEAFADTLRTVAGDPRNSVERFNENGFFADADAVAIPGEAITAPISSNAARSQFTPPAISSSSAADLLAQADMCRKPAVATAIDSPLSGLPEANAACIAAPLRTAAPSSAAAMAIVAPTPRPSPHTAIDQSGAPVRIAKARQPQSEAARSPIGVKFHVDEGAAAITVAAHGLTDPEAEALRTDIVALLRRYGLVLDDLRLNGRSTGRGQDRSGG